MNASRSRGFTLLPVILAMTIVAAVAFVGNRANALNADMIAGRADHARARYAAEAGLQASNFMVQRASCGGGYPTAGAPLVDPAFNGAAYTAYASAASGSPVTLTATGSYNGARVTLTRSATYVYQTAIRTYVLQPDGAAGVDTWLDAANSGQNRGSDEELALSGSSAELLLKFDLSFFPPGTRMVSQLDTAGVPQPGAMLELFKTGAGSSSVTGFVDAHIVSRVAWVEGTGNLGSGATWDSYNGTSPWGGPHYDARMLTRTAYQGNSGWQPFDVTDAVAAWMSAGFVNTGLLLRSSPAGPVTARYYSSDTTSNPGRRPKLTITYLLPCGMVPPA